MYQLWFNSFDAYLLNLINRKCRLGNLEHISFIEKGFEIKILITILLRLRLRCKL